jgi:hypothetical protein
MQIEVKKYLYDIEQAADLLLKETDRKRYERAAG